MAIALSIPEIGSAAARVKPLRFGGMVTFGDWTAMVKGFREKYEKDPASCVTYIIDHMADAGFTRVYWRMTDGCGQACYPSKVTDAAQHFVIDHDKFQEQSVIQSWIDSNVMIDFSKFDSVSLARDLAHKRGMEFWAWLEHAEDHGAVGQISKKALEHPEWLTLTREGKRSPCRFSWAIPEAVQYRVDLADEVMSFKPDGLIFDFVKSMPSTPGKGIAAMFDVNGVWNATYDAPAVEAFKAKTGRDPFQIPNDDPDWLQFRADYMTGFVRKVREVQKKKYPRVRMAVFGCPRSRPVYCADDKVKPGASPLKAYLEDHDAWTKQRLIDEFITAYAEDNPTPDQLRDLIEDSKSRVHAPTRFIGVQLQVYNAEKDAPLLPRAKAAKELGCDQVVLFETTPIEHEGKWEAVGDVISTG